MFTSSPEAAAEAANAARKKERATDRKGGEHNVVQFLCALHLSRFHARTLSPSLSLYLSLSCLLSHEFCMRQQNCKIIIRQLKLSVLQQQQHAKWVCVWVWVCESTAKRAISLRWLLRVCLLHFSLLLWSPRTFAHKVHFISWRFSLACSLLSSLFVLSSLLRARFLFAFSCHF